MPRASWSARKAGEKDEGQIAALGKADGDVGVGAGGRSDAGDGEEGISGVGH